jgi:hypothetical protein
MSTPFPGIYLVRMQNAWPKVWPEQGASLRNHVSDMSGNREDTT